MRVISHLIDTNEEAALVAALLGGILVAWNQTENQARSFVGIFLSAEHEQRARILTAHMGTTTLFDALNTCANEYADATLREHLQHFREYAERVRAYRNYYAHGIAGFLWTEEKEAGGWTMMDSAKGRLATTDEIVPVSKLREMLLSMEDLNDYGSAIRLAMRDPFAVRIYEHSHPGEPLPSWPDKPPLPDRLKKLHLYPLAVDIPPPPSEA